MVNVDKYIPIISKQELFDLYINKRMSTVKIAEYFGINYNGAIIRLLEYYQIPKRTRQEATAIFIPQMSAKKKGIHASPQTEYKKGHKNSLEIELKRGRSISIAKKGKPKVSPNEKTRDKLADVIRGERNRNWKGGITPITELRISGDWRWRKLREEIKKRDNFTCQVCGKKGVIVHHIKPWSIEEPNNEPENLITLCRSCHAKIDHSEKKEMILQ